jgi:hypothetical protein
MSSDVTCNVNKDCSTGALCIQGICQPPTFQNIVKAMPPWGWAIIVIGVLLIILGLVKCFCWPFDRRSSKKSKEIKGPVPVPLNYQKPVDLMEVAAAQRKVNDSNDRRKMSADSVYPSSSISNVDYHNQQLNASYGVQQGYPPEYDYPHPMGPPQGYNQSQMGPQQGYAMNQPQYGFQNQKGYVPNNNQVYYGNPHDEYGNDQMNYPNHRGEPDYNYRPY